jgi:surface antigen
VPRRLLLQFCYRGSLAARLRRIPAAVLVLSLALAAGGCSYQLDSMLSKARDNGSSDITGSVRPARMARPIVEPMEADLAIARATVSEALAKGGKDSSMPWENPTTGARGTVTPLASAYSQNGMTCQDFLASYVRNGNESWLQGEACRQGQGRWEVRHMKPWQRT